MLVDSWHVGSCAKAMTAYALGELVRRGQLAWTTTMASVFGELVGEMHPDMRAVTVRMLVDHRSGLPENRRIGSAFTRRIDRHGTPTEQRLDIVRAALASTPACTPGTARVYANTNYLLAGAALERVTGRTFEQAMQRLVFAPLGMASAGFGQPAGVRGHQVIFGKAVPTREGRSAHRLPRYYAPAGDVHLSLRDWARFAAAGSQCVELPCATDYALGWSVRGDELSHHGVNAWWRARAHVDRGARRVVVVACNQGGEAAAAAGRRGRDTTDPLTPTRPGGLRACSGVADGAFEIGARGLFESASPIGVEQPVALQHVAEERPACVCELEVVDVRVLGADRDRIGFEQGPRYGE